MNSSQLLDTLIRDVQTLIEATERDFLVLPFEALNTKRNTESWSILECFEHLNRYNRFYNKAASVSIEKAKESLPHPVKSTWIGKQSIDYIHPRNTKKLKTMKHLNPVLSNLDGSVIDEFLLHQRELLNILEKAKKVNLNTTKVPIEFFRLLKMNLGDALQFLIVHQQRHFIQLTNLLNSNRQPQESYLKV